MHPRWFYYWLRSAYGAAFIRTLARGAVRERMLFRRLAAADLEIPLYEEQLKFAKAVAEMERVRSAAEAQIEAADALSVRLLRRTFSAER